MIGVFRAAENLYNYMCFWHHAIWQLVTTIFFNCSYRGSTSYKLELLNLSPIEHLLAQSNNRNTRTRCENC